MGLHTEVFGAGQSETVVLLHGWAMHSGIWHGFAEQLAEQVSVLCIDLPGHGLSESVEPFTLEHIVDAVYQVLPEQACVVLGWSLGGNIALRLAEKYPRRVKSLVLIASNPCFVKKDAWAGVDMRVLKAFAVNMQKNGAATLLRFMSLQVQGMSDIKPCLQKIKTAMQACAMPTDHVLMGGLVILQTVDQRKFLQSIKIPMQIIQGDQDSLVPELVAEQCVQLHASIDIQIIKGAGHVPFMSHEQSVVALVQAFVKRYSTS